MSIYDKLKTRLTLAAALLLSMPALAQQQDAILKVLKEELQYSMQELKKQPEPPYFMSLRMTDQNKTTISSEFGAVLENSLSHTCICLPQIRLGNADLDNYKIRGQGSLGLWQFSLPLDEGHTEALRQSIWREMLSRYDAAKQVYQRAKTRAKTSVEEDKAPSFSETPPEHFYEPPIAAGQKVIDRDAWAKRLDEVSAVFKECPELSTGTVNISYEATRSYLVNTEGTEVVQNRVAARIMISASIKADDGMVLPLNRDFFAFNPDNLPSNEVLKAAARDIIQRLKLLKQAPVADPYTGPALLSGPASGVFFHEIFGHRLEGYNLKEGGQTFKKMVGQRVLPKEFQVFCDPSLRSYANTELNGFYRYDDEGVQGRRVNNVVNGVLKEFLMSRMPIDSFPMSNGHGRGIGNLDPVARQSNLVVQTTHPYTDAELHRMLIAEAKKQGKPYGYYFRSVTSGFTYTGAGGSVNSFNVTPIEVYRVFVDGRPDQLVRGVDLIGTPLSMFSSIESAGGEVATFNGFCGASSGWVPVSASSPMLFVRQIETQRRSQSREKPAILPAPEVADRTGGSEDDVIFSALQDELKRNQQQLVLKGEAKPFYYSYTVERMKNFLVVGNLGAIVTENFTPAMGLGIGNVQAFMGDYKRAGFISPYNSSPFYLPMETDYYTLRRAFWEVTDRVYRSSLEDAARKKVYLESNPSSPEDEALMDMQQLQPSNYVEQPAKPFVIDSAAFRKLVSDVSARFLKYKKIYDSQVRFNGSAYSIYRVTSEGQKQKTCTQNITFQMSASARTANGTRVIDDFVLTIADLSELPSVDELYKDVDELAAKVLAESTAPMEKEPYSGPVMYTGQEVGNIFVDGAVKQLVAEQPMWGQDNSPWKGKIGRRIVDKRISIKDCPTMKSFNGKTLLGSYTVDGDGVRPASELTLLEKGLIKNRLSGRYPTRTCPVSNGHERIAQSSSYLKTVVAPGVTVVDVDKAIKENKMKKQLIKAAKEDGLDYAYISRSDMSNSSMQFFKVDVKTGAETLMRVGYSPDGTDNKLKYFLKAASADKDMLNYIYQGVPATVIYPSSIIIGGVDIEPASTKIEKMPVIPSPLERDR
jgi:predicted Zn-dependent protease